MIRLPLNQNRDLPSLFTRALAGRCIGLNAAKPAEIHLYTALTTCWRKASDAATTLLNELEQLKATPSRREHFDVGAASRALKALIYDATETFDLYYKTIPERLTLGRGKAEIRLIREYQQSVKRHRDPIALICNHLKHNYREIVMGWIVSQATGQITFIYRINIAEDGVQRPDRQIHHESEFISLERTLHEIVHALLRADYNAGKLVNDLSDNSEIAINLKGPSNLGLNRLLSGLCSRAPLVAYSEPSPFDGVELINDTALLTRVFAQQITEPIIYTMNFTVDEAALSIKMSKP